MERKRPRRQKPAKKHAGPNTALSTPRSLSIANIMSSNDKNPVADGKTSSSLFPTMPQSNKSVTKEVDMLSALDRAAMQMIESAFKRQEEATYREIFEAAKGEFEIAKLEIKTVKTDLHLAQEHERYLQQQRGKLSRQLDDMDKVLALTLNHMRFLDQEYKTARNHYLEGQKVVETSRAESFEFLQVKQKAEQRCRAKEGYIERLDKTVEILREELAAEKARAAELENRYGV